MTAIGYVTKQNEGRYSGSIKTISIRADIKIIPNINKTADAQPDYRVLTQGIEIGAGWTKKGETSGKEYVSLALAAPEFGPRNPRESGFGAMISMIAAPTLPRQNPSPTGPPLAFRPFGCGLRASGIWSLDALRWRNLRSNY
jgi:uncharacterized protein (DUF736 family)